MEDPGLHLDEQAEYTDGYEGETSHLSFNVPGIICRFNSPDAYMPNGEFDLINSVIGDGIQKEKDVGLSTLAFDTHEELLWMGTKSGHVSPHLSSTVAVVQVEYCF